MAEQLAHLSKDKASVAEIKAGAPVNKIVTAADLKDAASTSPGLSYPVYVDGTVHIGRGGSKNPSNVTVGGDMPSNISGNYTANMGHNGLYNNTTGSANNNLGYAGLYNNGSGSSNNNIGYSGLRSNTTGSANNNIGYYGLLSNTAGNHNANIGHNGLYSNTIGTENNNTGYNGLYSNTTGSYNNNIGAFGLYSNTTGNLNSNIGYAGLYSNATGSNNSSLGYYAGFNGNYNNSTHIGANSQASADNEIKLGNDAVTAVRSAATFYGAGFVTTSDKRLKRNIAVVDGEKAAEFSRLVEFVEYDRVAGDIEIGKLKRRKEEALAAEEKRKADSKKVKAAKAGEAAQEDPGVVEPEFDAAAIFYEQLKQAEANVEIVQRHEAGVIAQQVQDITKKLGAFEWLVSREYADDPESALQVDYQSMQIILQAGLQYRLVKAGF